MSPSNTRMPAMAPQYRTKLLALRRKAYIYDMDRALFYRHGHGATHRDGPGRCKSRTGQARQPREAVGITQAVAAHNCEVTRGMSRVRRWAGPGVALPVGGRRADLSPAQHRCSPAGRKATVAREIRSWSCARCRCRLPMRRSVAVWPASCRWLLVICSQTDPRRGTDELGSEVDFSGKGSARRWGPRPAACVGGSCRVAPLPRRRCLWRFSGVGEHGAVPPRSPKSASVADRPCCHVAARAHPVAAPRSTRPR
jgi:hypothetical protein